MIRVLVSTPFPVGSPLGNSVSARRIAGILREAGFEAAAVEGWGGEPAECLVALHARRSAGVVQRFRAAFRAAPIVLVLPGSDLYGDLPTGDRNALAAIECADRLVVAQEASLADVPARFRRKAVCIPKSVDLDVPAAPDPEVGALRKREGAFVVLLPAHVRPQKNPRLAQAAGEVIAPASRILIVHCGALIEPETGWRGASAEPAAGRYRWIGPLPRGRVLSAMAAADVVLNTSRMEGGSNALCEAVVAGRPVVATRIPGNVGILGSDHPGLYPPENAGALAAILSRCETEPAFLAELSRRSAERARLFTRARELAGWSAVIRETIAERRSQE